MPNPKSLKNLPDRSAPDNPGETKAFGVRLRIDDVKRLDALPEGRSYHVRQAIALYLKKLEGEP